MVLQTRAAKIILLLLAAWLMGCAIVVAITGWDGGSSPRIGASASSPTVPSSSPAQSPSPSPEPTPQGGSILEGAKVIPTPEEWSPTPIDAVYLSPRFQGAQPGEEITFEVRVNLTDVGISGAEFEVVFPSEALRAKSLRPGDLLGANPLIAADNVDNSQGSLHYASARKGATAAGAVSGVLATLTFEVPGTAASGTYSLTLRNVTLTDDRFEGIGGLDIRGGVVEVIGR